MIAPVNLLVVLVPLLVIALALAWTFRFATLRSRALSFDEKTYPGLVRLRSATLRARWVGLVLGIVTCIALFGLGWMSQLALTGPPLAGAVAIGAMLVGQRLAQGAATARGSAGIERRRPIDYVPARLAVSVLVTLAALAATAAFTSVVAAPDDRGVPGRALVGSWVEEVYSEGVTELVSFSGANSPFPGSFYTVPMVVGLVVLLVVAWVALVAIAARPRNGADPELVRVDDALRRISAEGVVAATGLAIGLDLLFVSTLAFLQFGHFGAIPTYVAACYALALVSLAALVYTLRCFAVVAIPSSGEPS